MNQVTDRDAERKPSGVVPKSSPGAYAFAEESEPAEAEQRIAGLKSYHAARIVLRKMACELADAPARELVPGVTAAYVEAMRQSLYVLLLNADVAEGL